MHDQSHYSIIFFPLQVLFPQKQSKRIEILLATESRKENTGKPEDFCLWEDSFSV